MRRGAVRRRTGGGSRLRDGGRRRANALRMQGEAGRPVEVDGFHRGPVGDEEFDVGRGSGTVPRAGPALATYPRAPASMAPSTSTWRPSPRRTTPRARASPARRAATGPSGCPENCCQTPDALPQPPRLLDPVDATDRRPRIRQSRVPQHNVRTEPLDRAHRLDTATALTDHVEWRHALRQGADRRVRWPTPARRRCVATVHRELLRAPVQMGRRRSYGVRGRGHPTRGPRRG